MLHGDAFICTLSDTALTEQVAEELKNDINSLYHSES